MKRQDAEPTITMDPLQPAGTHWVHTEAVQGDVQARIDIRPYGDPRWPGGYVRDEYWDRADHAAKGKMGRHQKARALMLMQLLRDQVTAAMQAAGWRVLGHLPGGKTVWRFVGSAGVERDQQMAQAAARIWQGRYPRQGRAKRALLAAFPVFRLLLAKRWHPVGEGLEVWVDDAGGQVQVRGSSQPETVVAPPSVSRQVDMPAYQRSRHTRLVRFACARCGQTVEEQHFPGPQPRYCSACKEPAARERARGRVQRFRERQRAGRHPAAASSLPC